jgi:aspartyl-tRNA(Asn)/glutamyl-tRNA(Gln) amidotransferase subunit C
MAIDRKTVEHGARRARLDLPPEELARYEKQLAEILHYVSQLETLDVAGVEPLAHAGEFENVFRPDAPRPSLPAEEALRNSPERAGPYFVVPKILE